MVKTKPTSKSWSNAKLFHVYFKEIRLPVCGLRYAWAVEGYKWVRICIPFHDIKFKVRRSVWDQMDVQLTDATKWGAN